MGWRDAPDRSEGTDLAVDMGFPVPMFPSRDLRQVTLTFLDLGFFYKCRLIRLSLGKGPNSLLPNEDTCENKMGCY